jgi:hypothetical protein
MAKLQQCSISNLQESISQQQPSEFFLKFNMSFWVFSQNLQFQLSTFVCEGDFFVQNSNVSIFLTLQDLFEFLNFVVNCCKIFLFWIIDKH